jgi:hypothetical protein
MQFLKSIVGASYWLASAVMMLIGLGIIALVFMNSPLQLQIALGLIGLGFISLGLVKAKRTQNEKRNEERLNQIVDKLDEIQQELEKGKQTEGSGAAMAELITSGLKFYADQIAKQKKEE